MNEKTCPFDKLDKLLLCSDCSEYSSGAVREGISLAARCSSELLALSIIETNVEFSALAPDILEKEEIRVREHLESVRAQADEAGVRCETIVHEGETPWHFIVDEADERGADIIVMGRRGRSAMQKIMVGSVTARVIGHTTRPVLVAPRASAVGCGSVLLATDGSEYSREAARYAIDFGSNCGVKPVVVSVAGDSSELPQAEDNVAKVVEMAGQKQVEVEGVAVIGRPQEEIVRAAVERGVELIVIGSHGRAGLERLLMGSVAEAVIDNTECAVLVVRRT